MSYKKDFNISDAMKSVYGLGKLVSDNVFTGNRPQAMPEQMQDFVVVSIPNRLESSTYGGGYGVTSGYCNIEIFVKLKAKGMENQPKISKMLDNLLDALPYTDNVVQVSKPTVALRGSDGLGFSAVLVRTEIIIK